jgi:hypothetical protein
MRIKKILSAALVIVAISTTSAWKASAASTEMPNGTVVIGTKAFDLGYANDTKNLTEITAAIVAGGGIYIKGFDAVWINNSTSNIINSSVVPGVTYKSATGVVTMYSTGDKPAVVIDYLEVISIE